MSQTRHTHYHLFCFHQQCKMQFMHSQNLTNDTFYKINCGLGPPDNPLPQSSPFHKIVDPPVK